MARPLIIGVTGLPCSGKSRAARLLARGDVAGAPGGELFKADDVGHTVLERPEVLQQLRVRFGGGIEGPTPADTRRRIAERVFANPADLAWLESLVHPLVSRELVRAAGAAERKNRGVVAEAALLTAAGMEALCDVVLVVEAEFASRLRRAARRGWDQAELERRDARQLPLFAPEKLSTLGNKLILVRNDRDDNRLADTLREAWTARNVHKTEKE